MPSDREGKVLSIKQYEELDEKQAEISSSSKREHRALEEEGHNATATRPYEAPAQFAKQTIEAQTAKPNNYEKIQTTGSQMITFG